MGVNSLPKTVTRQRRGCDLNPGPSAPESSTLTTRLRPSHPGGYCTRWENVQNASFTVHDDLISVLYAPTGFGTGPPTSLMRPWQRMCELPLIVWVRRDNLLTSALMISTRSIGVDHAQFKHTYKIKLTNTRRQFPLLIECTLSFYFTDSLRR